MSHCLLREKSWAVKLLQGTVQPDSKRKSVRCVHFSLYLDIKNTVAALLEHFAWQSTGPQGGQLMARFNSVLRKASQSEEASHCLHSAVVFCKQTTYVHRL